MLDLAQDTCHVLQQSFWDIVPVTIVSFIVTFVARVVSFLDLGWLTHCFAIFFILVCRFFRAGIEIHEDVVQHCKDSIARWKHHHPPAQAIHHIDIIHGNALNIAVNKGEALLGFDRIYIGAAVDGSALPRLKKLLKPGGILVGPGRIHIFVDNSQKHMADVFSLTTHYCLVLTLG